MFAIPLIAAALAAPSLSAPAASVAAQPTGRWVVEFAEQYCRATHRFSNGAEMFTLGLEPRPTTEFYLLWLGVPKRTPRLNSAQVAVGGLPIEMKGMSPQRVDQTGRIAYSVQLTRAELLRLLASGEVRVTAGKWSSLFPLASLAKVQRTLDSCVADLLAGWGLSPQAQAELASFPKPEQESVSYATNNDYPQGALDRMASGTVQVRITVGADGKGKACHVMVSSGDHDLDATTCAIYVKRPRYQPARTRQGVAIEGPYVVRVTWRTY